MSTAVALPTSSNIDAWNEEERALLDAAGLVQRKQNKPPAWAPRATVAAFLQHCARTGLDPIARQIYAIERGGKWGIQISIDGARLVAQRSGQYAGQTPVEWTGDGKTWVDVWLESDPPKAARVGVLRQGFAQPLYATARWDSYAVMKDEWSGGQKTGRKVVSDMWAKMPDLMLGKVAEMLALRKAFPMELSGLYSSEEMAQADAPAAPVAAPAEQWAPTTPPEAPRVASKDWAAAIAVATDVDQLRAVYAEIEAAAEVGLPLNPEHADSLAALVAQWELEQPPAGVTSGQMIGAVKKAMEAAPVVAEVVEEPAPNPAEPVTEWATAEVPAPDVERDPTTGEEIF
ncbi:phage recombination protein Bet [Herbiconiux sp. UC225_62]|uniref:phage recombination protein Bet n=1 Tax=Herbiconiux sp. UC225_62 TaxID=3350168 RepID=UPI0036D3D9A8